MRALLWLLFSGMLAAAHEDLSVLSSSELRNRRHAMAKRSEAMLACQTDVQALALKRASRRARLRKRDIPTASISLPPASYSHFKNETCVLAPEVMEGPYWVQGELVRRDVRESEPGIPLILDIGIMDVRTCKPATDALVEIWATNSTGIYSGFAQHVDDAPPGRGPPGSPPPASPPSGPPRHGGPKMSEQETFLRGAYPLNADGLVEFTTIIPGWYPGRTQHIHMMVHTDYAISDNGTLKSDVGTVNHIGQLFFPDEILEQVAVTEPYASNKRHRVTNDRDGLAREATKGGFNAFLDCELIGEAIEDGILAYVTVGVDFTEAQTVRSTNRATSIDPVHVTSALAAMRKHEPSATLAPPRGDQLVFD